MKKLNIPQTGKTKASSKYRNNKTEVDGIWFDSKKEADRYCVLLSRQRRKEITDLKLQVRFKLEVNGVKICSYIADFTYMDNGELIVEDVKSTHTAQLYWYVLKKRLMKACHAIDVRSIHDVQC